MIHVRLHQVFGSKNDGVVLERTLDHGANLKVDGCPIRRRAQQIDNVSLLDVPQRFVRRQMLPLLLELGGEFFPTRLAKVCLLQIALLVVQVANRQRSRVAHQVNVRHRRSVHVSPKRQQIHGERILPPPTPNLFVVLDPFLRQSGMQPFLLPGEHVAQMFRYIRLQIQRHIIRFIQRLLRPRHDVHDDVVQTTQSLRLRVPTRIRRTERHRLGLF